MRPDKHLENKKTLISGTGCALGDFLYNSVSFNSVNFKKYMSQTMGDGGISPGKLVFAEDLEKFSNKPYQVILNDIIGPGTYDGFNAGGPSLVSLIHVSQLLNLHDFEVGFFGIAGNDETSAKLFEIIHNTPLNIDNYHVHEGKSTPFTHVFSDPDYDQGVGERTFVNNLGAALDFDIELLTDEFFDSNITCFGGTALVPNLHDNLTHLLVKAKRNNCITVVNTVFDFRAEKNNSGNPWPLVATENIGLIDILIMDCEEALKISGESNIKNAARYFASTNVSSFFITNGPKDIFYYSKGNLFEKIGVTISPVSEHVINRLQSMTETRGDTTGCGDNFAGGVIASLAWQLRNKKRDLLDPLEALSWGVASGGFSCFTLGGVYIEKFKGEKLQKVKEIKEAYLKQINYSERQS
jgi:sugar/nucleoside kinase (ribokinase family)